MGYEDRDQHVSKPKYECLLFDVDDTLYPLSSGLSKECTKNIKEYMVNKLGIEEDKVPEMCIQLYKDYGTTMAGLRAIGHHFDYGDFHRSVHGSLPYKLLKPDPVLKSILLSLPIQKVIFSNANKEHVAKVLGRLGLEDCFEQTMCFETLNPINKEDYDAEFEGSKPSAIIPSTEIDATDNSREDNDALISNTPIVCKPSEESFEQALKIAKINPRRTLFFDDSIRNLQTAKRMGFHTVWVGSSSRAEGVDYAIESIHNIRAALPVF